MRSLASICVAGIVFILLFSCPWYVPTLVDYGHAPADARFKLTFKDAWGRTFSRIHIPSVDGNIANYNASHLTRIETTHTAPVELILEWVRRPTKILVSGIVKDLPAPMSGKSLWVVRAAMVLFSGFMGLLAFLLIWQWQDAKQKNELGAFVAYLPLPILLLSFLILLTPGLFGWDIFLHYQGAARFEGSMFTGTLYALLLMAGFHLVPELWIVTAANVALLILSLSHIHAFAWRNKRCAYFWIASLVFVFYPGNFQLIYFPSRDFPAFLCFCMTMFKAYECRLHQSSSSLNFVWLTFYATLAVLLRQEAALLLGLLFVLAWTEESAGARRGFWRSSLVCCGVSLVFSFASRPLGLMREYYETTLIVHPLSSILHEKYPSGLPPEIDTKLGSYFKNDYLIRHYSPLDINPFHQGGINYATATKEQYEQFRTAALQIIVASPEAWLRSRLKLVKPMLGFVSDPMFLDDRYYNLAADKQVYRMHQGLPTGSYKRFAWFQKAWDSWSWAVKLPAQWWTQSYLIPLSVLLLSLGYFRSRLLCGLSFLLLVRSLLVFIVAPAAYYKYHLPIWIFSIFIPLYASVERESRASVTNP